MKIAWNGVLCFTSLTALAWTGGASDVAGDAQSGDALHVHLHNASHGQLVRQDGRHEVHVSLLRHNASHSVLHLNSSTADLHKDVLVSGEVVSDMQLDMEPVNGSDLFHGAWSGHEQLVATKDGWVSSPLNGSVTVEDREGLMAAADQQHQDNTRLVTALLAACAGVVLIAGVGIWVFRGRRHGDAALLGEDDEEFTVFSVVDHPYPGKKGDNYSPLP